MTPEKHLFIVWNNALPFASKAIELIGDKLEILDVRMVEWSESFFSNNLSRFYGQNLPNRSFKEKHCGRGAFLCVICQDNNPIYEMRNTISRGNEKVNIHTFDLKQALRHLTGGGHRIHGTNNEQEFIHDIKLLFNEELQDVIHTGRSTLEQRITMKRDITGSNGWSSFQELFSVLNATTEYVVLRNFQSIHSGSVDPNHNDIDLLVKNRKEVAYILNASPTTSKKYRAQYVCKVNGVEAFFDIRSCDDNYFDGSFAANILSNRVMREFFYAPSDDDHRYSLLYHALIHKQVISIEYEILFRKWFNTVDKIKLTGILLDFIEAYGYEIVEPNDLTVYYADTCKHSLRRKLFYFLYNAKLLAANSIRNSNKLK